MRVIRSTITSGCRLFLYKRCLIDNSSINEQRQGPVPDSLELIFIDRVHRGNGNAFWDKGKQLCSFYRANQIHINRGWWAGSQLDATGLDEILSGQFADIYNFNTNSSSLPHFEGVQNLTFIVNVRAFRDRKGLLADSVSRFGRLSSDLRSSSAISGRLGDLTGYFVGVTRFDDLIMCTYRQTLTLSDLLMGKASINGGGYERADSGECCDFLPESLPFPINLFLGAMLISIGGFINWRSWDFAQGRRGASFIFGGALFSIGLIVTFVALGIW